MSKLPIKKIILRTLGVVVLAATIFVVNLIWFKPFSINHFFTRVIVEVFIDSPQMKTQFGVLESMGITGHNAHLGDNSMKSTDEMMAKFKDDYKTLLSYDDADLDKDQLLSKQIMVWFMEIIEEAVPYRYHTYPMNPMMGSHTGIPSFLDTFHVVNNKRDGGYYLSRLSEVSRVFDQELEGLEARQTKGIIPPTFIIDKVLETMKNFVGVPATENILYTSFVGKMENAEEISEDDRIELASKAATEIETTVYPAYNKLIAHFEQLKPLSNTDAGYWRLPDGDKVYALALKLFNTTDMTPDEIHNIGLSEVARIQGEMLDILEAEGFDRSKGYSALMEEVLANPDFYYEDSDAGRTEMLADYTKMIDEMWEGLDQAFVRLPKSKVEVRRIPAFKEKTTPAHYNQPAIDGSRPGLFFANLGDMKNTPKFGMRTLTYHESVPGHHMQVAKAMEAEGLPLFRKMGPFSAFSEGWALYSEQLAYEMGYFKDPYDNLGRLASELFRAVRLVVDSGLHAKKWTREAAIDYMMKNASMAEVETVREIERYIVLPGQATSYKIGMLEILRLREQAKAELGDKFDLKQFHASLLENGAMPLVILREQIEAWIETQRS